MNIPCDQPCPTCTPFIGGASSPSDPEYPFVNLSSEDPDIDNFIGRRYGHPLGNPNDGGPPLGDFYYAIGCIGFCVSSVSQAEADLCAQRQQTECLSNNWPEVLPNPNPPPPPQPPPPNPNTPVNPQPRTTYANTPQSRSFNCPDGSLFTYTVEAGTFYAFSQAAADAAANSYALLKAIELRLCVSPLSPVLACAGALYAGSITASSGKLPINFTIVGDLPDGLFQSGTVDTLLLTGRVNTPGDYTFTVVATDSIGHSVPTVCALTFFGIVTDGSLPEATVDAPYLQALVTGGTVTSAITYTLIGVLPDGLTLNAATGIISGTPISGTGGEYNFTIVAHADGLSCPKEFFMTVGTLSNCVDWATLYWGIPDLQTIDGGTATFDQSEVESSTFNASISAAAGLDYGQSENAASGGFYNGGPCDCNLHLEAALSPVGVGGGYIEIFTNLGTVLFIQINTINSGAYDFPFTLPDTGGSPVLVTVHVFLSTGSLTLPETQVITGVITNV